MKDDAGENTMAKHVFLIWTLLHLRAPQKRHADERQTKSVCIRITKRGEQQHIRVQSDWEALVLWTTSKTREKHFGTHFLDRNGALWNFDEAQFENWPPKWTRFRRKMIPITFSA